MILNTSSTVLELGSAEGLILKGFIAAVLGGFVSLPGTFAGGLWSGWPRRLSAVRSAPACNRRWRCSSWLSVLLFAPDGLSRQAKLREV